MQETPKTFKVTSTSLLTSKKFRLKRNWEKHQFHLVANSSLPILMSFSTMLVALSIVFYWHPSEIETVVWIDFMVMHFAFIMFTLTLLSWFIMIVLESQAGHHTAIVQQGLRLGVILFIVSEAMFFFAFFWAYFHYSVSPSVFIGDIWPPAGTQPLDPWGLPLSNTLLLLSSGVTITFAHNAILKAQTSYRQLAFMKYLLSTIILGVTFLICQGIEYKYGITFSWKENVYGSIFFLLTGFHGLHVTFGTLFLWFCLVRAIISRAGILLKPIVRLVPNFLNHKKQKLSIKHYFKSLGLGIFHVLHEILKKNAWAQKIHNKFAPASIKHHKKVTNQVELTQQKPGSKNIKLRINNSKLLPKITEEEISIWLKTFGFTPKQHVGFEAAVWYWHFVDVVWLLLYIVVYLW